MNKTLLWLALAVGGAIGGYYLLKKFKPGGLFGSVAPGRRVVQTYPTPVARRTPEEVPIAREAKQLTRPTAVYRQTEIGPGIVIGRPKNNGRLLSGLSGDNLSKVEKSVKAILEVSPTRLESF